MSRLMFISFGFFHLCFNQASKHLIVPLLAMVGELTRRQNELIKVIQNKDKEIDDYKSQGVKTSRSKLIMHMSTSFDWGLRWKDYKYL